MDVTLASPMTNGFLDGLDRIRVTDTSDGGKQVQLSVQGSPRELLARLATLPVEAAIVGRALYEGRFRLIEARERAGDRSTAP